MKPKVILTYAGILIVVVLIVCSGCKVTKQIQKTDTETTTESKSDSSVNVQNDIKKESTIETTTTEIIDTTVFVTPEGKVVADTAKEKGKVIPVHIRKKKTIKTNSETTVIDKTKSKTELKKQDEKKIETNTVVKDIKKTGIAWYWWIILFVLVCGYLAWRFYFRWQK